MSRFFEFFTWTKSRSATQTSVCRAVEKIVHEKQQNFKSSTFLVVLVAALSVKLLTLTLLHWLQHAMLRFFLGLRTNFVDRIRLKHIWRLSWPLLKQRKREFYCCGECAWFTCFYGIWLFFSTSVLIHKISQKNWLRTGQRLKERVSWSSTSRNYLRLADKLHGML